MPDADWSQTITATNLLEKVVELQSVESTISGLEDNVVGGIDDPGNSRAAGLSNLPHWNHWRSEN